MIKNHRKKVKKQGGSYIIPAIRKLREDQKNIINISGNITRENEELAKYILTQVNLTNRTKYLTKGTNIYDKTLLDREYTEYFNSDFLQKFLGIFDVDKGHMMYNYENNELEEIIETSKIVEQIKTNYDLFINFSIKLIAKLVSSMKIPEYRGRLRNYDRYIKYLEYSKKYSRPFRLALFNISNEQDKNIMEEILYEYINRYTLNSENIQMKESIYLLSNELILQKELATSHIRYSYFFSYFLKILKNFLIIYN